MFSDTWPDKFSVVNESLKKITFRFDDKVNRLAAKLKSAIAITDDAYRDVYASGSGPGNLYGLPQVHKTNFSEIFQMRPIFAARNTPSYKLTKYLVPLLSLFSVNDYTVKNASSSALRCVIKKSR